MHFQKADVRNVKTFFADITSRPPVLFPWVALFHICLLIYSVITFIGTPLFSIGWLQPLWMLAYTIFWIFICDMRKWAGYGYVGLTLLNLILYMTIKPVFVRELYTSSLFLIDILFSFFVLFFFRRFQ